VGGKEVTVRRRRRRFKRISPYVIIINIVAWGIAFVWLLPFIGLFMTSIRPYSEVIIKGWWNLIGAHISFHNYASALFQHGIARGYLNSFIIAIPASIIPVFLAAMCAYALARFSFPLRSALFLLMIVLMAVPQQTMVIPLFFLLKDLHLLNRLYGLILVHSAWGIAWITFFMRNFFNMLPKEIEEVALVDGASYWTIFRKIVLPVSLPAIASALAIQFTWVWSDFFFALMFLYSPSKWVVTQRVVTLRGAYYVDWGLLSAGSILAMLPPLILYAALQKYYLRGMVGWATGKG